MTKHTLSRDLFTCSAFDEHAKKQSLFVAVFEMIVFVIAALCMFNFFYVLCDFIGSIVSGSANIAVRDLLRSMPILFTLIAVCHVFVQLHYVHRNVSAEKTSKGIMYNACAAIALAGASVLWIIIGCFAGIYGSLVRGYPTMLYPLDAMLGSLVIIAYGICAVLWNKKWSKNYPIVIGNRADTARGVEKGFHHTFVAFWIIAALYGLGAAICSTYIVDWTHGHVFYSVMLVIMYLLPTVYLLVWEFFYNELKKENRRAMLPLSVIGVLAALVVVCLYMLAYNHDPQAPDLACFGILAVDYTASVNAATFIYTAFNLIIPAVALIKILIMTRTKKEK